MAGFLGLRATSDFVTNQDPQDWNEYILYEYPNGSAPITALTSLMKKKATSHQQINWWTKGMPQQESAVSSVYIDVGVATEYVYATHQATYGIAGGTVHAKVAEAVADEHRAGHLVMLLDADRSDFSVVGKVTQVIKNGASSVISIKLLEDDDNSATAASYNIGTADRIVIIGNVNPEGGDVPQAITYNPTQSYNYTSIVRDPLFLTGSADETVLRTDGPYKEAKTDIALLHALHKEKTFLWSVRYAGTGANGKPEYTMRGLFEAIREGAPSNVKDFTLETAAAYSGKTWLAAGEDWLDNSLADIFAYGDDEKLAFGGNYAAQALATLAKAGGQINLTPRQMDYGIQTTEWVTPHGIIHFKRHPLFSYNARFKRCMLIIEPRRLVYRPRKNRDTKLLKNRQNPGVDGIMDEFLSEFSMEYSMLDGFGILHGLGSDNAQS